MITYIMLLMCLLAVEAFAQPRRVVAFYNVENLMDTQDDPRTLDEDMLPLADKNWDEEKYQTKIRAIYQVMSDLAVEYDKPALLGLAEVENKTVLNDLVAELGNMGEVYEYCHYDSSDERGVDVALLYRPKLFEIQKSQAITPDIDIKTRDMLAVWGKLCGEEVLVVVVHLPSRIGGVKFTEHRRMACCRQLREMVDSVRSSEPYRRVIVMGDMNDNPRDKSIKQELGASERKGNGGLYNPFIGVRRPAYRGSSVYRGEWNLYDNIILSTDFIFGTILQLSGRGNVFKQGYLLDKRRYPKPTYRGVEYCSGVSDHLPVYVVLR